MSDDTRWFPCCEHCHDMDEAGDIGHGGHCRLIDVPCDRDTCPGSVPVGPTKEGKQ